MKSSTYILKQAVAGSYKLLLFEMARRRPRRFVSNIKVRPIRAMVNVTYNCNSRCVTCYHWKTTSEDDLTAADWSDILSQLRKARISDICLSGGEPMLRDDLAVIVRAAHALRFDRIHMVTNGLIPDRARFVELIENGLTSIYVSLNGDEQVHDKTRGISGAYTSAMNTIKTLVELRNTQFPALELNVLTIIMGPTVDQLLKIADMCRQLRIGLSFSPLNTSRPWQEGVSDKPGSVDKEHLGRVIGELHDIKRRFPSLLNDSHASLEYIKDYMDEYSTNSVPCYLGYLVLNIGPHGEVFPGCLSLPLVGNLREESLGHIMDSKACKERITDMFFRRCPGCACDYILNTYAHLPSVVEEIKWRTGLKRAM